VGFVVDKVAMGQHFLSVFLRSPLPCPHHSLTDVTSWPRQPTASFNDTTAVITPNTTSTGAPGMTGSCCRMFTFLCYVMLCRKRNCLLHSVKLSHSQCRFIRHSLIVLGADSGFSLVHYQTCCLVHQPFWAVRGYEGWNFNSCNYLFTTDTK